MKGKTNDLLCIRVNEFYNHPEKYRYMPMPIFDALEKAFLEGKETALVPENDYYSMINKIIIGYGIESN